MVSWHIHLLLSGLCSLNLFYRMMNLKNLDLNIFEAMWDLLDRKQNKRQLISEEEL